MTTTPEPNRALYRLDVEVNFAGPLPDRDNRAAPEVSEAHFAAVDALREVLRGHGYVITSTGHGSLRVGSAYIDPLEELFNHGQ